MLNIAAPNLTFKYCICLLNGLNGLERCTTMILWFNGKKDPWIVVFACAFSCFLKQCPVLGVKDMPGIILNNRFRSCYHILAMTSAMWMHQGSNASCWKGILLFSIVVAVRYQTMYVPL